MLALIDNEGYLFILPETTTESYALKQWFTEHESHIISQKESKLLRTEFTDVDATVKKGASCH